MKIFIYMFGFFVSSLLYAEVHVTKDINSSVVDIRNSSALTVIVNLDMGSFKIQNNQALLRRCYDGESIYLSVQEKINHDFFVDCGSKIVIIDD